MDLKVTLTDGALHAVGKVDTLGHLPANVLLLMITVVGNIRPPLKGDLKPVYIAILSTIEFIFAVAFILALYYVIHWLQYE